MVRVPADDSGNQSTEWVKQKSKQKKKIRKRCEKDFEKKVILKHIIGQILEKKNSLKIGYQSFEPIPACNYVSLCILLRRVTSTSELALSLEQN